MKIQDYSPFISDKSKRTKPSAIRALQQLNVPGLISLGGGLPNPSTFPIASISYTLKNGESVMLAPDELNQALQYSQTPGFPKLIKWFRELQNAEHGVNDFDICLGNGSQDVLAKAFDVLLSDGDPILIEAPAYVGILAYLKPMQLQFYEIPIDGQGLHSDSLKNLLSTWDPTKPKPKVLYTVPTSGNPTGVTTTLERKKQVYALAQEHNFIIVEDDPYYYLQSGDRVPTYFSMDTDGRVIRFDSLSKTLSAGIRIGWASGPPALINQLVLHAMSSNLHPSGLSQILVLTLLEKWGVQGYQDHTRQVASFYTSRRDVFLKLANKYLAGLAEWEVPKAGMFIWFKLIGITDSKSLINEKAREKKVLLVPGTEFFANETVTGYVRASYSTATDEQMELALERLRELLLEVK